MCILNQRLLSPLLGQIDGNRMLHIIPLFWLQFYLLVLFNFLMWEHSHTSCVILNCKWHNQMHQTSSPPGQIIQNDHFRSAPACKKRHNVLNRTCWSTSGTAIRDWSIHALHAPFWCIHVRLHACVYVCILASCLSPKSNDQDKFVKPQRRICRVVTSSLTFTTPVLLTQTPRSTDGEDVVVAIVSGCAVKVHFTHQNIPSRSSPLPTKVESENYNHVRCVQLTVFGLKISGHHTSGVAPVNQSRSPYHEPR